MTGKIVDMLLNAAEAAGDRAVRQVAAGGCLAAVDTGRMGLAAVPGPHGRGEAPTVPPSAGMTALGLASRLRDDAALGTIRASLGLAAVNSLLPPPSGLPEAKAQDILLRAGAGRRVAVVGHFPFVERLAPALGRLDVLELRPRPGDIPSVMAPQVLPLADAVLITGSTLVNGTLEGLLELCRPEALVILAGPSVPFAACLFELGVDVLAGCEVSDVEDVLEGVASGLPFRALGGVRQVVWQSPAKTA